LPEDVSGFGCSLDSDSVAIPPSLVSVLFASEEFDGNEVESASEDVTTEHVDKLFSLTLFVKDNKDYSS